MRAKTLRPALILLALALCALPLTAAPAADGGETAAAPSWSAQLASSVSGWLTGLFPAFGAAADAGLERRSAADGIVLGDDPIGDDGSCATCVGGEGGEGGGDDNGGPDWDPNG